MVAGAIDIVILHKEDDRDADVGEDLAVRVVKGAPGVVGGPDLTAQNRKEGRVRNPSRVRAALSAAQPPPLALAVRFLRPGIPDQVRPVGQPGKTERSAPFPGEIWKTSLSLSRLWAIMSITKTPTMRTAERSVTPP